MSKLIFKAGLVLVAALMMGIGSAGAAVEYTWDVGDNGNWGVGSNWSGGIVPNSNNHQAWIDNSGANVTVYLNMSATVSGLKVDTGDTLLSNSDKSLYISKDDIGNNPFVTNLGTIKFDSGGFVANNATVTITGTGSFINPYLWCLDSGIVINDTNHTIRGKGTIHSPITNKGNIIGDSFVMDIYGIVTNEGIIRGNTLIRNGGINSGSIISDNGNLTIAGSLINYGNIGCVGNNELWMVSSTDITGGQIDPQNGTVYLNGGTLKEVNISTGKILANFPVDHRPSTFKGSNNLATGVNLTIQDGATLKMSKDGVTNPVVTNNGTIKLSSSGSATYLIADDAVATLTGTGSVVLGGNVNNYLTANLSGSFINDTGHTIRGGGVIEAAVENRGAIIADNGTLKLNGPVTGTGSVSVAGNAYLDLNRNLQARNFSMSRLSTLDVADNRYIDLKGNWSFAQTDESKWIWSSNTTLKFSGAGPQQTLEVGGEDQGAVLGGFSSNFDLVKLSLSGAGTRVQLADAADNGNRHSSEALYADILEVLTGATLDLYGKHLYTLLGGSPHLVLAGEGGLFGGGDIIDSPPPVPAPATLLLLGSGLLGLVMLGKRRGERK